MQLYNKIMSKIWLVLGIISLLVVTYMGFKQGFRLWYFYYLFSATAFAMYFLRRWMTKRMEKHMEWLKQQEKNGNNRS